MAFFVVRKKIKKIKKKKLNTVFSKSIGVHAASDARGQYLTESKEV
jgi:hypothetical protein